VTETQRILVVDDDAEMRLALELTLKKAGHNCALARDGQEALESLREESFALVVTDLRMPRVDGIELLERMAAAAPDVPAIVITAHGSVDAAVETMKRGALDFLQKPFGPEVLLAKVDSVLARSRPPRSPGRARTTLVANDPAMEETVALIEAASGSKATVLISGESGTGKEVVARRIHESSPWHSGPFVAVNCAAIPGTLMESELFGHEKGAFTGAVEPRQGKFEQAQGGTILLDEVSEMELSLQAKLLRVLQEREVERVGGRKAIALDLRVVATSNRDLTEEIRKGKFREDLFYRLHVIPIRIPPLRQRRRDVVPLARYFLDLACRSHDRSGARLSPEAEAVLEGHDWPGNVRELQNTIERAAVLSRGTVVEPKHLLLAGAARPPQGQIVVDGTLEEMERRIILAAYDQNENNKKATARALGINVKTLRSKLRSYGIDGTEEGEEESPPEG
jgi:two-component system response regulator FlrC